MEHVGEMVFQFDRPHQPGTVCGFPCEQCGADRLMELFLLGDSVPNTPMLIVAPATREDWLHEIAANCGASAVLEVQAKAEPGPRYYYRVAID